MQPLNGNPVCGCPFLVASAFYPLEAARPQASLIACHAGSRLGTPKLLFAALPSGGSRSRCPRTAQVADGLTKDLFGQKLLVLKRSPQQIISRAGQTRRYFCVDEVGNKQRVATHVLPLRWAKPRKTGAFFLIWRFGGWTRQSIPPVQFLPLRQDGIEDITMHIGQPHVTTTETEGLSCMVNAQQVKHRGV